jgi:hypothetical protein
MSQIGVRHKRNQIEFSVCRTSLRLPGVLMAVLNETDLYAPVKQLLEQQGYTVRAEVDHCDLVAVRGGEPPVIVELKRRFALSLVYQGIQCQGSQMRSIWPCRADRPGGVWRCGTASAEPCCSSVVGSALG